MVPLGRQPRLPATDEVAVVEARTAACSPRSDHLVALEGLLPCSVGHKGKAQLAESIQTAVTMRWAALEVARGLVALLA